LRALESGDRAPLVSLFTATLQFTSESPADAIVPPDGREGLYLGSGNGVVSGERVRGALSWSFYSGNCLYPLIRRGQAVPDDVHLCTLNPGGFIDAATSLVASLPHRRVTVGGDKGYFTRGFVDTLRALGATPHVALKAKSRTFDRRTTRHPGYAISQRARKRIEEIFGWMRTIGGLRKLRHRGGGRVNWQFLLAAAVYNLVRMRTLEATA